MIVTALIATSTKVLVLEAHQFLGAPKMLDDAGLSRDHTGRGWARAGGDCSVGGVGI